MMSTGEETGKMRVSRPPLERMMRIHNAVSRGEYPNTASLSRELEVSRKSVMRDLNFMRERLNMPIEYDAVKYGYYYTSEVAGFPNIQISEGELFALLVAEKALQQYKGTPFEKPLLQTLQKLADSLPETISMNLAHWDESISFQTTAEPIMNLEVIDALSKAAAKRSRIRIAYRKAGGNKAEIRDVDPYHLANIDGGWYLFGYCHLRAGVRTFSPLRIQNLEVLGIPFEKPDFDVRRQLSSSFGVITGDRDIQVVCRFSDKIADFIREKKWHPTQKIRSLPDGRVEFSVVVSSLIEIRAWILSWGGEATVIEPAELKESIEEAARQILGIHSDPAIGKEKVTERR